MDVFFHALTGLVISKGFTGKYLIEASVFSALSDIGGLTFSYYKAKNSSKETLSAFLKDFVMTPNRSGKFYTKLDKAVYRSTHSLFSIIPVGFLAYGVSRQYWWVYLLCYLSHFLIDAPTHENDFSQMPFYPLSKWSIKGKVWTLNKKVFFTFWLILILISITQMVA